MEKTLQVVVKVLEVKTAKPHLSLLVSELTQTLSKLDLYRIFPLRHPQAFFFPRSSQELGQVFALEPLLHSWLFLWVMSLTFSLGGVV